MAYKRNIGIDDLTKFPDSAQGYAQFYQWSESLKTHLSCNPDARMVLDKTITKPEAPADLGDYKPNHVSFIPKEKQDLLRYFADLKTWENGNAHIKRVLDKCLGVENKKLIAGKHGLQALEALAEKYIGKAANAVDIAVDISKFFSDKIEGSFQSIKDSLSLQRAELNSRRSGSDDPTVQRVLVSLRNAVENLSGITKVTRSSEPPRAVSAGDGATKEASAETTVTLVEQIQTCINELQNLELITDFLFKSRLLGALSGTPALEEVRTQLIGKVNLPSLSEMELIASRFTRLNLNKTTKPTDGAPAFVTALKSLNKSQKQEIIAALGGSRDRAPPVKNCEYHGRCHHDSMHCNKIKKANGIILRDKAGKFVPVNAQEYATYLEKRARRQPPVNSVDVPPQIQAQRQPQRHGYQQPTNYYSQHGLQMHSPYQPPFAPLHQQQTDPRLSWGSGQPAGNTGFEVPQQPGYRSCNMLTRGSPLPQASSSWCSLHCAPFHACGCSLGASDAKMQNAQQPTLGNRDDGKGKHATPLGKRDANKNGGWSKSHSQAQIATPRPESIKSDAEWHKAVNDAATELQRLCSTAASAKTLRVQNAHMLDLLSLGMVNSNGQRFVERMQKCIEEREAYELKFPSFSQQPSETQDFRLVSPEEPPDLRAKHYKSQNKPMQDQCYTMLVDGIKCRFRHKHISRRH